MSNSLRVTNSRNRNEIEVETLNRNCLSNFVQRIRNLCECFGSKSEENEAPLVHAVDSVRLVYMRRIEEASLLNLRRQNEPEDEVTDEVPPRIIRHRRMKQEQSTIEALEKALREYESKHKAIISNTRVPDSVSFDKSCKISRSSQTDKNAVMRESIQLTDEEKTKISLNDSEEITSVMLNNSNDKWTNTDYLENMIIEAIDTKKEFSMEIMENINV